MTGNEENTGSSPSSLPTRRDPQAGRRPEDVAVGIVVLGSRLGMRAGRVAILPLRVAGRLAGASRVERATSVLGADGKTASAQGRELVESVVDRTLAGPLPDQLAEKLVEHHVIERIAADVMKQIDLDALVTEVLADEQTREQFERALTNPALERLAVSAVESKLTGEVVERLLASPQVHAAIARQSTSMAGQLLGLVRDRLRQIDDRLFRRATPDPDVRYGGIATRAVALTTDAVLAHLAVLVPAAVIAIIASLAGGFRSGWVVDTILGLAWIVVGVSYFTFFWTFLGQTPGMILMHLRVMNARGEPPTFVRSVIRLAGLVLSIALLFTGFLPILFDGRRRGLADFLAGTTVRAEQ
jgi:uncharacterized RDD family membrane protein YckC